MALTQPYEVNLLNIETIQVKCFVFYVIDGHNNICFCYSFLYKYI